LKHRGLSIHQKWIVLLAAVLLNEKIKAQIQVYNTIPKGKEEEWLSIIQRHDLIGNSTRKYLICDQHFLLIAL